MKPIDEQDVAALYCALRDGICDVQTLTWWQRFLDFVMPERAAQQRRMAIEQIYREWQEARTEQPTEDAPAVKRMNDGTLLAIMSVRAQLARKYDGTDAHEQSGVAQSP